MTPSTIRSRIEHAAWWRAHLRRRCGGIHHTPHKRVMIDHVQRVVAMHYGVTQSALKGESKTTDIVFPRHVAMYLSAQLTGRSLSEIGRRFGDRDHSTVIHAVKRIRDLRACDWKLDAVIETLAERASTQSATDCSA